MTTAAKNIVQPFGRMLVFSFPTEPMMYIMDNDGERLRYSPRLDVWDAIQRTAPPSSYLYHAVNWRGGFESPSLHLTRPRYELGWQGEPTRNFVYPEPAHRGTTIIDKGVVRQGSGARNVYGAAVMEDDLGVPHVVIVTADSSNVYFEKAPLADWRAGNATWTLIQSIATSALWGASVPPHGSFMFNSTGDECVQVQHDALLETDVFNFDDRVSSFGTYITTFSISTTLLSISYGQEQDQASFVTYTPSSPDQTSNGEIITDDFGETRQFHPKNGVQDQLVLSIAASKVRVGADYKGLTQVFTEVEVETTITEQKYEVETPTAFSLNGTNAASGFVEYETTSVVENYRFVTTNRVNRLYVNGVLKDSYVVDGTFEQDHYDRTYDISITLDASPAPDGEGTEINGSWYYLSHRDPGEFSRVSTGGESSPLGGTTIENEKSFLDVVYVDNRYGVAGVRKSERTSALGVSPRVYSITNRVYADSGNYVSAAYQLNDTQIGAPLEASIPGNISDQPDEQCVVMYSTEDRTADGGTILDARQFIHYGIETYPPNVQNGYQNYLDSLRRTAGQTVWPGAWAVAFLNQIALSTGQIANDVLNDAGLTLFLYTDENLIELVPVT